MIDEVEIKERIELVKELQSIYKTGRKDSIPIEYWQIKPNQVDRLSTVVFKGILFQYYTNTRDISSYKKINNRLRKYIIKINKAISEEEYTL